MSAERPDFGGSGTSPDAEQSAKDALDKAAEAEREANMRKLGELVKRVQKEETNPWFGAEEAVRGNGPELMEIPTPDQALRGIMIESRRLDMALDLLLAASKDHAKHAAQFHTAHARHVNDYMETHQNARVTAAKASADVALNKIRGEVARLANLKDFAEKLVKSRQGQLVAAQSIKTGVFALPDAGGGI